MASNLLNLESSGGFFGIDKVKYEWERVICFVEIVEQKMKMAQNFVKAAGSRLETAELLLCRRLWQVALQL